MIKSNKSNAYKDIKKVNVSVFIIPMLITAHRLKVSIFSNNPREANNMETTLPKHFEVFYPYSDLLIAIYSNQFKKQVKFVSSNEPHFTLMGQVFAVFALVKNKKEMF